MKILLSILCCAAWLVPEPALAQEGAFSPNATGMLGLNTVPSARMDEPGTARIGVATLDPYIHGFIGFQIAEPLYVSLRQSSESSDLFDDPARLYPGMDFKLRLLEEGAYHPAIAIGAQSALGHKRMAGEYVTATKSYKNFDLTGGIGWGRFGSAGHISNPLKALHSHFGQRRNQNSETPNDIHDWFTGENIGFFAGLEYFTPIKGLSFKADWGADRNTVERSTLNFSEAAPWSIGANFAPIDGMDISLAMQGTDKIMARLNLQGNINNWPLRTYEDSKPVPLKPARTDIANSTDIAIDAYNHDHIKLQDTGYFEGTQTRAKLIINPDKPAIHQAGRAARHMANNSPKTHEALRITPYHMGLRGPSITMMRRDFETALIYNQGSPEEVWRNTTIEPTNENLPKRFRDPQWDFKLTLNTDISLSEEDTGVIYRTALLFEETKEVTPNILPGNLYASARLRLNLKDNLHRLQDFRPRSSLPVRSDIDLFTDQTFAIDRAYFKWLKTIRPDLHLSLSSGYLEEQYGGVGGEILYRPFGKTFALGAEAWGVLKRDPAAALNAGYTSNGQITGHINGFYEVPNTNLTASLSAGRYLAGDIGATAALEKRFDNGAQLKGFVTTTNQADFDIFGSSTHLYSGLSLSVPIGSVKYIPEGSMIETNLHPLGRETGQKLDTPMPLYEVTEPLSYRSITRHWNALLD